jgi:L-threonylcarbamoyladenylate synthase
VSKPSAEIAAAVEVLRAGGLVAFPTETVYGLGADASNADALARLYRVKGRPLDHPVIVHLSAAAALDDYACDVPDAARAAAAAFWPGPLTVVLRKRPDAIADAATGGRPTVGLRVPDHPVALALLEAFGRGIAAPSANRFGRVSPTTAAHVRADLGTDVDLVLEGGATRVGVESTIVDFTNDEPAILRVGGIAAEELARVLGRQLERRDTGAVAAPGTLPSHYAPDARVEVVTAAELAARAVTLVTSGARVGVLAMAPLPDLPPEVRVLGAPGDVAEFARVLYARLRDADGAGLDVVLAAAPSDDGLGVAIRDRLRRASAGRTTPPK